MEEPVPRGMFCNRTLNLRRIQAIGYDMDYTLIHYRMRAWEERAYYYLKRRLADRGWPVEDLTFEPDLVMRGLILDTERGNIVKANRFGYIKHAMHGTEPFSYGDLRDEYERTVVDLNEPRWYFLNTLFSISEAGMFMQLVDLLDAGKLESSLGYQDLYQHVRRSISETHLEGQLKADIIKDPEQYVDRDEQVPLTLLDQKEAGKEVLLITNSEWDYAAPMLEFALDPYLPSGMTWRDLFDIAIVGARKPDFFSVEMPAFEVTNEDGLLRTHRGPLERGNVYVAGNAALVERSLGLRGEEILYVGDHLFTDVNVTKNVLRWRTALVLRELEGELEALDQFRPRQQRLEQLMEIKESMEAEQANLRLEMQRNREGYGGAQSTSSVEEIEDKLDVLQDRLSELDDEIAPLAREADRLLNPHWGPLMRAGKDKSHLARQVERYADVYTSRVSNFLHHTPFAYLRSHRGSLPHDASDSDDWTESSGDGRVGEAKRRESGEMKRK
jgi:HAD superfamily 5'-nucleotidase-like hydrolase